MRSLAPALLASPLLAVLAACHTEVPHAPPPPEVTVTTIAPRTVEEPMDFTGEVQPYRTVQVRAQETGVITERLFREGAEVHKGEVLYRIDPTTTDADWRSAKAHLAEARARLANSTLTLDRLRPLLADNAVAKQDVDNAVAQVAQDSASVEDARAAVDRARKNLDETTVRAEISGRVGRALLDVGARVTGSSDVLTSIDVIDPVYVSFRPSAQQQFAWRRDPALRRATEIGGSARVEVVLPDSSVFPTTGRIGYIDPVVDPSTGTQEYRAEFANAEHLLLPGAFVHVRLRGLLQHDAIVVPQRAVLQQMGRTVVYVVGAGDSVAAREVTATDWAGSDWLIASGLHTGDRVVVDGVQKVMPGAVVHPVAAPDSATDSTHAGTPGAPHVARGAAQ